MKKSSHGLTLQLRRNFFNSVSLVFSLHPGPVCFVNGNSFFHIGGGLVPFTFCGPRLPPAPLQFPSRGVGCPHPIMPGGHRFPSSPRIAVFSVTVLHDDRIVLVAEQRPDASEEDSFQWMSRVLQVGVGPRLRRPRGVEQALGSDGAMFLQMCAAAGGVSHLAMPTRCHSLHIHIRFLKY